MKSYLDLVPVSAKVHRKQSRMSVFCITLAVFLVTAIFGMADMFIRSQILQAQAENGNWHIAVKDVNDEKAALIAARPEIETSSSYGVINYHGDRGYTLLGKNVAVCGSDETMLTGIFTGMITEGKFPETENEALVTENARDMYHLKIGDLITVQASGQQEVSFTVTGFAGNTSKLMSEDSFAVFLQVDGFRAFCAGAGGVTAEDARLIYYIRFADTGSIQNKITNLKSQTGLSGSQVMENTKLLGLLGQSSNSFMMRTYAAAVVLFLLVLTAGILMISSSLNSNVAQRTEFFGLIRCIGATPKQVMRLVQKEALSWCGFAVPAGVAAGIAVIWILCLILKILSPEYFSEVPVFGFSIPSIAAGVLVGFITVLLAARAPAKRASAVPPLTAVSGNANDLKPVKKAADTRFFKVDTALGIHHAKSSRKNFILMVGSFSFSIILFLSFSVTVDFMKHSLTPLRPWAPDLSVVSPENRRELNGAWIGELQADPAVRSVYGRMFAYGVPAIVNGEEKKIDLISYEEKQFEWAGDYLLEGSLEKTEHESGTGLIVYERQNTIQTGDTMTLTIGNRTADIKITGMLSDSPFKNEAGVGMVICSEETFRNLTGESSYTIIDMKLAKHASDADVDAIRKAFGTEYTFLDERMGNRSIYGTYLCIWLFLYGFLVLIALITIFHVVNSIAMSVSARMKQYGAFRAIGLGARQLAKMIAAEALTYTAAGIVCGGFLGLACNRYLFHLMISLQWGDPWTVPWTELGIIVVVVVLSVVLAVKGPIRKINEMSIVDTINAQ